MPRTPDRFPGESDDEGIVLSDAAADPTVLGEIVRNGNDIKAKDGTGVFNLRSGGATPLVHKAGQVAAGSFTGTPKKATVTFTSAFADANYAVTLVARTQNNDSFLPIAESQAAGSFVINLGTDSTTNLLGVNWVAVKNGESS